MANKNTSRKRRLHRAVTNESSIPQVSSLMKHKGKPTMTKCLPGDRQSPYTDIQHDIKRPVNNIKRNRPSNRISEVALDITKKSTHIPKRMSFFWAGKTMSWLRFMTVYSFSVLNPGWEIKLYHGDANPDQRTWTCPNMQDFLYPEMDDDYFHLVKKLKNVEVIEDWSLIRKGMIYNKKIDWDNIAPIHKCDIIEWKILGEQGGFFSDFDILFIRPMNAIYKELKHRKIETGICYQNLQKNGTKYFSIGFLCSNIINTFYDDVYKWAVNNYDPTKYQSTGAFALYCLLAGDKLRQRDTNTGAQEQWLAKTNLVRLIKSKYPDSKIHNFEMNVVYPYTWRDLHELYVKNNIDNIPKETIGLHWYGGSEASQMFNRSLTQTNWNEYNNTICNAMAKFLTFPEEIFAK